MVTTKQILRLVRLLVSMPNVGDTITPTLIVCSGSQYLYTAGLPFKIDNVETNIDTVYVGGSVSSYPMVQVGTYTISRSLC